MIPFFLLLFTDVYGLKTNIYIRHMTIHFIAIGGAAMHNLALALHDKGYTITGSDDEIFEPSKGRLAAAGILPEKEGWFPEKLHAGLDAVILGMHARKDNPELEKALELGLQVYSFPEFIYEQTRHKKRVVIGGSHGKTTITSMVMHVLRKTGKTFDYLVGSQLEGFRYMASLREDTDIAVIEGDEYLASPIQPVPKFHLYHPHIAVISGIAWDHINVFPTFEEYSRQFDLFIDKIEPGGVLFYADHDATLASVVANNTRSDIRKTCYHTPAYRADIQTGRLVTVNAESREFGLQIFGQHNLLNASAAQHVCAELGIKAAEFWEAMTDFTGAARRLELLFSNNRLVVFRDFAHSPSKLKATVNAVKEQFGNRKVHAIMELHTFSSLNKTFLDEYAGSMDHADSATVYYSPHTVAHKKLEAFSPEDVRMAFQRNDLAIYTEKEEIKNVMRRAAAEGGILLLMSSGNWGGIDLSRFAWE